MSKNTCVLSDATSAHIAVVFNKDESNKGEEGKLIGTYIDFELFLAGHSKRLLCLYGDIAEGKALRGSRQKVRMLFYERPGSARTEDLYCSPRVMAPTK